MESLTNTLLQVASGALLLVCGYILRETRNSLRDLWQSHRATREEFIECRAEHGPHAEEQWPRGSSVPSP